MTQINDIRKLYFEEDKNIRQIAKATGFDRKTVRNYLKRDDFNSPMPSAAYVAGYPKLNPFKPEIDKWQKGQWNNQTFLYLTAKNITFLQGSGKKVLNVVNA